MKPCLAWTVNLDLTTAVRHTSDSFNRLPLRTIPNVFCQRAKATHKELYDTRRRADKLIRRHHQAGPPSNWITIRFRMMALLLYSNKNNSNSLRTYGAPMERLRPQPKLCIRIFVLFLKVIVCQAIWVRAGLQLLVCSSYRCVSNACFRT